MRNLIMATALAVAFTAPASAEIVEVKFTNIVGSWFAPTFTNVGTPNTINNAAPLGAGSATARWGVPSGQPNQSGYDFLSLGDLVFNLDTATDASAVGNIATFRHLNFPITASGGSLTGIRLNFNTDVLIDNVFVTNTNFVYAFDHFETPNQANPCADGGALGVGVNGGGCADRVRVNFESSSGSFQVGDTLYALAVRGFLVGNDPATQFWTAEGLSNEALIRGQVVTRSLAGAIPEPATWAMLIAGFGMVGAAARRRRPQGLCVTA
jgi:hypothetical protein